MTNVRGSGTATDRHEIDRQADDGGLPDGLLDCNAHRQLLTLAAIARAAAYPLPDYRCAPRSRSTPRWRQRR